MKRTIASLVALIAAAATLAACSSSSKNNGTTASSSGAASSTASAGAASSAAAAGSLTIGSADFTENTLLADIYGDALSAKGVKVTKKLNIGERSVYWTAMKDGSIDFIPEYNGSILPYLDPKSTAKSTADVDAALKTVLGAQFTALDSAPAEDSDTITVTAATAAKYHLTSIGDLAPVAGKLTFGAPAAFQTRPDGIPSLQSVYGVKFGTFTALSASGTVTITSLKNGTIDAGDIFSTDSSFSTDHFVALQDPKNMFAAQNITPIVTTAKLTPTITTTVNAISAKLTTAILADLDAKAGSGDPDPVAKSWLASVGLG
jgi:osmoprotectant transport system substrate-binding protein